jgi:hypothetical protein
LTAVSARLGPILNAGLPLKPGARPLLEQLARAGVVAPTPDAEALSTCVAADLHHAGEIIWVSAAIPDCKN